MKAQRCASPLQAVVGVLEGKNSKSPTLAEATQVLMYFDRLQQLVPFCPKDQPISRLELIQSVIDYICDLQDQLAASPEPKDETQTETENEEAETEDDSVFDEENNQPAT